VTNQEEDAPTSLFFFFFEVAFVRRTWSSPLTSMEDYSLGVRKGAWTEEEDMLLRQCVEKFGEGKWYQIPLRAGSL
jgi:hypothetical protein